MKWLEGSRCALLSLALFFALGTVRAGLTFAEDTPRPRKPTVIDDGTYTSSSTSLHARWESKNKTGIAEYQYLIRQDSKKSGPIIVGWTSAGLATEVTHTGLSLLNGKSYFIGVRARNETGNWSKVGYSDGITVQTDTISSPPPILSYQGFGAGTLGGEGQPVYHVTNLNDSGPGSLRDALSQGNSYIVFDVGGVIETSSSIYVKGANITVDGFTAPPTGITIRNYGLKILGKNGAHGVIIQGIRVHITNNKAEAEDGITVGAGAYNVIIQNVSIRGASDENIGINNAHDVTVAWSILAEPIDSHPTNMLITNGARRISVHHNLFIKAPKRNPWIAYYCPSCSSSSVKSEAPEIQADVRNNLMWDVSGGSSRHGTVVFAGGKANIVNNYYKASDGLDEAGEKRAIVVCKESDNTSEDMSFCGSRLELPPARAYVAGNLSADGWTEHINTKGSETEPFPTAPVDTTDACTAAQQVLAHAGVPVPDLTEQQYLALISLSACPGS